MLRTLRSACRRFHRDEGGQAIFLGVFYFALLAGLVFLVVNSGHKANNKIQLQNTADAVAGTGARNGFCIEDSTGDRSGLIHQNQQR